MPEKTFKIINGDSLEELKKFPDNYFDSIVTDPPYGLGKEPDATEMLKAWVETGYIEVKGTGFMGKKWDAFVPQPLFWKEVYRVLKHGGHVAAFFGTRTYDWGCMAIRLAGFEIRDSIQFAFDDSKYRDEFINSLTEEQRIALGQILKNGENIALWNYGSGFPKSLNVGKAIDKIQGNEREIIGESPYTNMDIRGKDGFMINETNNRIRQKITKGNSKFEGFGTALKPAVEPIVLARKPLEKGLNVAQNVLKWGTGGLNIDGCRVGFTDGISTYNTQGRFPANLILTHHPDCECVGTKKVKGEIDKPTNRTQFEGTWNETNTGLRNKTNLSKEGYGDENGEETVEDWNCVDGCPIKIMDEQSGILKSGKMKQFIEGGKYNVYGKMYPRNVETIGDSGGASRFFYTAKASKSERNFGLGGFDKKSIGTLNSNSSDLENYGGMSLGGASLKGEHKNPTPQANIHTTVKPIKLMQYLAKLITPPNGKVLDPFNGSGTTGIACMLEGFEYTGIELDAEYCKISEARILAWNEIEEYQDYKKIIENNEDNEEEDSKGGTQISLFD